MLFLADDLLSSQVSAVTAGSRFEKKVAERERRRREAITQQVARNGRRWGACLAVLTGVTLAGLGELLKDKVMTSWLPNAMRGGLTLAGGALGVLGGLLVGINFAAPAIEKRLERRYESNAALTESDPGQGPTARPSLQGSGSYSSMRPLASRAGQPVRRDPGLTQGRKETASLAASRRERGTRTPRPTGPTRRTEVR